MYGAVTASGLIVFMYIVEPADSWLYPGVADIKLARVLLLAGFQLSLFVGWLGTAAVPTIPSHWVFLFAKKKLVFLFTVTIRFLSRRRCPS